MGDMTKLSECSDNPAVCAPLEALSAATVRIAEEVAGGAKLRAVIVLAAYEDAEGSSYVTSEVAGTRSPFETAGIVALAVTSMRED